MNNLSNLVGPVLVTGATGYIGASLVKKLVSLGVEVHIIVRSSSKTEMLIDVMNDIKVHTHHDSTESMLTIFTNSKPKIVFHLASLFITSHRSEDIEDLIKSNILFSTQLVEAMLRNKTPLLVNTGTSWQHFCNAEYDPTNLYAATKQAFEVLLTYYLNIGSIKVTTLALFDTYGPNDPRLKLIPTLMRIAESGEILEMSPGEQLIDMVHIDDVISAFLHAALILPAQSKNHMRYGIASGKPISLRELVSLFERLTEKKIKIKWGCKNYKTREIMKPWSNYTSLPGWSAQISLDEGIKDLQKARNQSNQVSKLNIH